MIGTPSIFRLTRQDSSLSRVPTFSLNREDHVVRRKFSRGLAPRVQHYIVIVCQDFILFYSVYYESIERDLNNININKLLFIMNR